jgi:hypothetical protein
MSNKNNENTTLMKSNELKDLVENLRPRVDADIRMNRWIAEVARSDERFAVLAGFAEGGIQTLCFELSDQFYSAERTRERDEQIARCYSDELRPPTDDGDDWRENLERTIEDRFREELIKLALHGGSRLPNLCR